MFCLARKYVVRQGCTWTYREIPSLSVILWQRPLAELWALHSNERSRRNPAPHTSCERAIGVFIPSSLSLSFFFFFFGGPFSPCPPRYLKENSSRWRGHFLGGSGGGTLIQRNSLKERQEKYDEVSWTLRKWLCGASRLVEVGRRVAVPNGILTWGVVSADVWYCCPNSLLGVHDSDACLFKGSQTQGWGPEMAHGAVCVCVCLGIFRSLWCFICLFFSYLSFKNVLV